jgi:antitoxin ParD1/3/4
MAISAGIGKPLEEFVTKLVTEGRYGSKSEVLREGLRLLQEREARLAVLNAKLDEALADVEAGRLYDLEEVFDKVLSQIESATPAGT